MICDENMRTSVIFDCFIIFFFFFNKILYLAISIRDQSGVDKNVSAAVVRSLTAVIVYTCGDTSFIIGIYIFYNKIRFSGMMSTAMADCTAGRRCPLVFYSYRWSPAEIFGNQISCTHKFYMNVFFQFTVF